MKEKGLHFRRQAPIGRYVVDFACHRAKLVIEVDGSQHAETAKVHYDNLRTLFLESRGYHVLRFWNVDVLKTPEAVIERILCTVSLPPTRTPSR